MQSIPFSRLDRPTVDVSLLIIRVAVGVVFMYHGAQKMFGWFDGPGLKFMMGPQGPGGGGILGLLVSIGECFGGFGIAVGFLSRFSAAANIVIMIGAIAMVHGKNGFGMQNNGFEYNWALIGLLAPILVAGPGAWTIGRFLPLPRNMSTGRPILPLE